MVVSIALNSLFAPLFHSQGVLPSETRIAVFADIFRVFLGLGTVVGVLVIGYMLYNAYRYRDGAHRDDVDANRPILGELPTGGGGGRKLLFSFTLSAIIVVSLIVWTYGMLLYVETTPAVAAEDTLDVRVQGYQFGWRFIYPNGYETNELRVPAGQTVRLTVTSEDVFHNFGIPALRVKTDAIPGQTTDTWFVAEEPATYQANCYELCGAGHSFMNAQVVVMEPDAYDEWYSATTPDETAETENTTA